MLSGKTAVIFDACIGFYSEEYFREMLVLERKRSERSKKPFLFVTIELDPEYKIHRDIQFSRKMQQFIKNVSREIDIKGWLEKHRTMGLIYNEYNPDFTETILAKIRSGIETGFGPNLSPGMSMSWSLFPEEAEKADSVSEDSVADQRFYPSPSKRIDANKFSLTLKRCIDIAGSFVGIVFLSPVFVFTAIAVKLSSKGPVFFTQKRVGQGGRLFTFIKFRSMRVSQDCSAHKEFIKQFVQNSVKASTPDGAPIYKMKNDPRITPIGKFLRKSSIDEIPQLFNVLAGDMSLVGPRPAIPYEVEEYDTWHRRRVLEVKPGITGFWQVKGRSFTSFEAMVRMDIQYITRWSLWWDLVIIFQTPFALFKGAY